MIARTPKPDPCIVLLKLPDGSVDTNERRWQQARECPHGCGRECKRTTDALFEESWGWKPGGMLRVFTEPGDELA